MFKLIFLPFKITRLFFKLAGLKSGFMFLIGVAVGLLVAPQTGPELRAKLQARLAKDTTPAPLGTDISL